MRHLIRQRYHTPEFHSELVSGVIVTREELLALSEAETICEVANKQAAAMVASAEARCRALAEAAAQEAEREVWLRAHTLLEAMSELDRRIKDELVDTFGAVFEAILEKLMIDLPERDRLLSTVNVLVQETQVVGSAVLKISQEDWTRHAEHLAASVPCQLEVDAFLAVGQCRLCVGQGEWRGSFSSSLDSLSVALELAGVCSGPPVSDDAVLSRDP
ncbi:HrpE/YscL family type III secretion apparatus protein [Burkholderia cepacia]|uniref:HrpE/YscL family type III secretion apparatus protein n=1 Tax=Burkholderia cepacia TaxID=292 RepID=UPI000AB3076C|nr:HrpE/YscL family type III secretion apparatus protein [Burkholderia cepacia]